MLFNLKSNKFFRGIKIKCDITTLENQIKKKDLKTFSIANKLF